MTVPFAAKRLGKELQKVSDNSDHDVYAFLSNSAFLDQQLAAARC